MSVNSPKSIVTGGAGFIGSNLVRHLLGKGHRVLNIDKLTYAGNLRSLDDVAAHPNYEFLQADIADAAAMNQAFSSFMPDTVFHLAAESHVDRSIHAPLDFVQTNVVGTAVLLQATLHFWENLTAERKAAFRFIHVSTDEVFGSLGEAGSFSESSCYDPHSPYSASKAASDHLVRSWHDTYGLPAIVTNCANNHGPRQYPEKLIPLAIINAISGKSIPIYGDGMNVRDWIHVEDHCEGLLAVAERGICGETYLIGANAEWRNIDLVRNLCQHLDELHPSNNGLSYANQIQFVNDRPGHDFRYAIDSSKIRRELGWKPRQSPSDAFRSTVQWYLEHENWWRPLLR
ncbi:dTDP-glucose 4,6-dehydratase [Luteolibacter pohnpeiensis]|uniref:dTDP-glucose 4,6-dehydratase n=1 Tax=Luteolibacter pohnpeiensis TaxID=454153 RepID=A0A934SBL6_9BACT|nr:dTDP-glucose 4,6-dehydratase [Luteolibacter pohnpeiensis]MBK1883182.1 dTDP-glucose 4,6-dehydratase [Luteolibacter pohnpeiensis]